MFLFPSLSDTFGNVVLEALASGLPVAAYDTAAAAEHVIPGATGLLAAPGDEAAFVAAACDLAARSAVERGVLRDAAVAAARRARWSEVLCSFEARLQAILDAVQEAPSDVAATA